MIMSEHIQSRADSKSMTEQQRRARRLGLWGLVRHWSEVPQAEQLVQWEEQARKDRSLERRIGSSRIGRFKSVADFDWDWAAVDRTQVEELLTLDFLREPANVFFVGPNGVGKTMFAKNIAHKALMAGYSVRFCTASDMVNDLAAQETASARHRRLKRYAKPDLLVLDELGYLSYDNRFADLLYEVVQSRYQKNSTLLTTNRPFSEWGDLFPNATCVVTLIDRLTHCAEIIQIQGDSYRHKEARERAERKAADRKQR
jgi:DNA replication protein DnaC